MFLFKKIAFLLILIFPFPLFADAPPVNIQVNPYAQKVKTTRVMLSGNATATRGNIKSLVIGNVAIGASAKSIPFQLPIFLDPGENTITIEATLESGETVTKQLKITRIVPQKKKGKAELEQKKPTEKKEKVTKKKAKITIKPKKQSTKTKEVTPKKKPITQNEIKTKKESTETHSTEKNIKTKPLIVETKSEKVDKAVATNKKPIEIVKETPQRKVTHHTKKPALRKVRKQRHKARITVVPGNQRRYVKVYIAASPVRLNPSPYIYRGRTMVAVAESDLLRKAGLSIIKTQLDGKTTVFIYGKKNRIIQVRIGEGVIRDKNGSVVLRTDVPTVKRYGKAVVPIRFVMEAMGKSVSWNNQTKTVSISG